MEVTHDSGMVLDPICNDVTQETIQVSAVEPVNPTALTIAIEEMSRSAKEFCSTGGLHALRTFDSAIERASAWVARDDLDTPVACGDELLFRAVRLVLSVQSQRLRFEYETLASRLYSAFDPDWETPEFWNSFVQATHVIDAEIGKVSASWQRYRGKRSVQRPQSTYVSFAGSVLDQLRRIERMSVVERLLYRSIASPRQAVSTASQSILSVLKARVSFYAVDSKRRLSRGQ